MPFSQLELEFRQVDSNILFYILTRKSHTISLLCSVIRLEAFVAWQVDTEGQYCSVFINQTHHLTQVQPHTTPVNMQQQQTTWFHSKSKLPRLIRTEYENKFVGYGNQFLIVTCRFHVFSSLAPIGSSVINTVTAKNSPPDVSYTCINYH